MRDATRVPGAYLDWANRGFMAFFPVNRINNLRAFNLAFSSSPTAPAKIARDLLQADTAQQRT
jgi:hypothetical protein